MDTDVLAVGRWVVDADFAAGFLAVTVEFDLPVVAFRTAAFAASFFIGVLFAVAFFCASFFAGAFDAAVLRAVTFLPALFRGAAFFVANVRVVDFRAVVFAARVLIAEDVRGAARTAVRLVADFLAATFFTAVFFVATFFVVFFIAGILDAVFVARFELGLALRDTVGLMRCLRKVGSQPQLRCKDAVAVSLPNKSGLYRTLKPNRRARHRTVVRDG